MRVDQNELSSSLRRLSMVGMPSMLASAHLTIHESNCLLYFSASAGVAFTGIESRISDSHFCAHNSSFFCKMKEGIRLVSTKYEQGCIYFAAGNHQSQPRRIAAERRENRQNPERTWKSRVFAENRALDSSMREPRSFAEEDADAHLTRLPQKR